MKSLISALAVMVLLGVLISPVYGQRAVEPSDLKISPTRYRNSSIVIKDYYFNYRTGIPPSLTAAGYTLDRYIAFGLREAGIWCFLRRTAGNEGLVGKLENGDRITIRGTVRQPKAKVERGRFTETHKFDMYLLEAGQVNLGWE